MTNHDWLRPIFEDVTRSAVRGVFAPSRGGSTAPADTPPNITGVPTISGTPTVGETLTTSPASVSGTPAPVRTWQWLRDGVDIAGATANTYLLVTADASTAVSVEQTETNGLGFDSAISTAVAVTAAPSGTDLFDGAPFVWDNSNTWNNANTWVN